MDVVMNFFRSNNVSIVLFLRYEFCCRLNSKFSLLTSRMEFYQALQNFCLVCYFKGSL